jgi:hypothetical protein
MKKYTKTLTKKRSNVYKLQVEEHGNKINHYVFARNLGAATNIIHQKFAHKNVVSVQRLYYG